VLNSAPPNNATTVKRLDLDLSADLSGQKLSAAESVREMLKVNGYLHTDLSDALLPRVMTLLDKYNQKAALVMNGHQLVTALPPDQHMLGLAVDLGTHKIGAYLVDLETGQVLASASALNPQAAFGEDILSRIRFADNISGTAALQNAAVEGINRLTAELSAQVVADPEAIVDCVIAGNTAMHHLLIGLPVRALSAAPHHPSQVDAMSFAASQVGLKLAENACVYLPPNIAGLVGGDHIAALLATRVRHTLKTVLLLDFGALTEISLLHKGRHLVCSCGLQKTGDIHAGVTALMREAGIESEDIDLALIGGNFDFTDYPRELLLPELTLKQIQLVGNAAGSGACELLLSIHKREEAESMPEHIEYVDVAAGL
jgi:uncharacterized 2Fe-2S/4Fe-4S cluster protein (DUF4445 family)